MKYTGLALALVSGAAFVSGLLGLQAFATGLGISPGDFGLDFRGTVTLAVSYVGQLALVLIPPILGPAIMTAAISRRVDTVWLLAILVGDGLALLTMGALGIDSLANPDLGHLQLGGGTRWIFLVSGALSIALMATLIVLDVRARHGASRRTNRAATVLGAYLRHARAILTVFAVVIGAFGIRANAQDLYWWGVDTRLATARGAVIPDPGRFLQGTVLNVQRGILVQDDRQTCADRIGEQVFVLADSTVVIRDWDTFVSIGCRPSLTPDEWIDQGRPAAATSRLVTERSADEYAACIAADGDQRASLVRCLPVAPEECFTEFASLERFVECAGADLRFS